MAPTQITPIDDDSHFETLTTDLPQECLQVRYFHAPWAAPCAQMSSVLEALASTYEASTPPTISFQSLNAEELPDISESHEVTAVPFIVLVRAGNTLDTISGSDAAKVRASVEKHYKGSDQKNGTSSALPPAQEVTRPQEQPLPKQSTTSNKTNEGVPSLALTPKNENATSSATRNLAAYSPNATDPSTGPEYSSKQEPSLKADSTKQNGAEEDGTAQPKDLHERLTQLTTAAPVMLFMKGTPSAPQCGFSRQLVSILRENSVRYGFFNILADEEVRQGLKEFADWPTFPQLWMGGELVGGLDIVKEEIEGDAAFFEGYSVDTSKRNAGGPAAAEAQAQPS